MLARGRVGYIAFQNSIPTIQTACVVSMFGSCAACRNAGIICSSPGQGTISSPPCNVHRHLTQRTFKFLMLQKLLSSRENHRRISLKGPREWITSTSFSVGGSIRKYSSCTLSTLLACYPDHTWPIIIAESGDLYWLESCTEEWASRAEIWFGLRTNR